MVDQQTFSLRRQGDISIATVHLTELNASVTDTLLADLREPFSSGQRVKLILDLSIVKFIDSVALGTLVVLLRRVKQTDGRLALVGLTGHCRKVMQVTSLEKAFELYDTLQAALDNLAKPS